MSVTTTIISNLGSIQAYNRGPLATAFTAPTSCLSTVTSISGDIYFAHGGTYFDTACFPASISSTQAQGSTTDSWGLYYYSPGQCPSGWHHAMTMSSYFSGAWESPIGLSLGADTTAVLCCPSGFTYGAQGHQCLSSILSGVTLTYFEPSVTENSWVQGSVTTSTCGEGLDLFGDGIPVWWQSSDLAAFTGAPLTGSSASSSIPTTTASSSTLLSTPSATGTPLSPPSSSGPSGLSTGGKVAIGVCIPIAFFAILFGVFFFFRYRKLRELQHQVPPSEEHFYNGGMTDNPTVQIMSDSVHELPNERPVAEIGSNDRSHLGTGQQTRFTSYS